MERLKKGFIQFCTFYATFLKYVVSMLIPLLILTVTYQITARYVRFIPRFLWTEEICRFTLNWLVMIGAALAIRTSDHFVIDILPEYSPRFKTIRSIAVNFIILLGVLFFAIYGRDFAVSGLRRRSLAAGLSMVWVYSSFAFFGVSSFIFQLEKIVRWFTDSNISSR